MDKAIVLGAFEFLGFHCCSFLLESGLEVNGVHLQESDNRSAEIMRLDIGRNSNFIEIEESKWCIKKLTEPSIILIDYYDLYIRKKETRFQEIIGSIFEKDSEIIRKTDSRIVLLLPLQLLIEEQKNEGRQPMHRFLEKKKIEDILIQKFYLPTIYGPFQSQEMLFQQSIMGMLNNENNFTINDREWIGDAIFVKDVVKDILMLSEEQPHSFSYLMKSNIEQHWEKCASHLRINLEKKKEREGSNIHQPIDIRMVYSEGDILNGLQEQKKVFERLL
ncbi:hypothetical protein ACE38V_00755 [Cytobacillus sp. Hz8]|uniref:hypothetical protein n=1 Tax=Cytobacillus sp. Hz8 TaxID=3347168 RepID=UPI0035D8F00C